MLKKLFSGDSREGAFFRRVDWSAFWVATLISMLVYFFTLGPSVTLEDSGELAVAGDHLGVPHPPGYPIWTICAYFFARLFSWVTYQGQPTPAWSISLMSAVFAALAAGLTAMLITRSASDMLRDAQSGSEMRDDDHLNTLAWAGGVGGSLVFAFSPVMWSQATIVEVYTLNAFFLMWIFLLTYRWMRRPSDKILWLTAFVFGLGLTNYQVLLLAAVPLVVVIFLRNLALFRDFLLVGIPIILSAHVLQIGAMMPAQPGMIGPAYAKASLAVGQEVAVPAFSLLVTGCVCVFLGLLAALLLRGINSGTQVAAWRRKLAPLSNSAGTIGAGLTAFGAVVVFLSTGTTKTGVTAPSDMPLLASAVYTQVAGLVILVLALSIGGACSFKERLNEKNTFTWLLLAGGAFVILLLRLSAIPTAVVPVGYTGEEFSWALPMLVWLGGMVVLFLLSSTIPRGLFYALPVAAAQTALFILLRKGGMNGLTHPTSWWFWWGVLWNFVVLALVWLTLPNGRNVALTAFFAELGVSFYVYMPIVSDLRNPPMNWGYPRTWEGFKHAITRGQYEKITPTDMLSPKFIKQLGSYCTDLRVQFTLLAATLGFIPFTLWSFKRKASTKQRWRAGYVASGIYLLVFVLVGISEIYQGEVYARFDKLLLALLLLLVAVGGVAILVRQMESFALKTWQAHNLSESLTAGLVLAAGAAALLAILGLAVKMGLGMMLTPLPELAGAPPAAAAQAHAAVNALRLQGGAILAGVVALISLVIGLKYAEKRWDFRFDADDVSQHWLIATTAGFLMMSVVLVGLANIKGDLQDAFIQKVKFISSHGLFAIWIGYGLAFGLAVGNRLLKELVKRGKIPQNLLKPLRRAMICAGVLVAAIPIYENYNNEYLVFSMSGAEQNGHTFGWQFGNYQLRGADAINEELRADQEPPPNPIYPLEMEPNAYFFGGTDPGRFVPTYMIYSAQVRPDVFLVTQNALADNTYINTMRDLYGNDVWMPTPEDSAQAFQIYVDEVQSGKRPKNADLTIENGRVQVSGALGVMEINGILTEMIFKKNKERHAFYIEESYVIQWMFPYLTPHGLIMKINKERTAINRPTMRDDMYFWDWYTRHLLRDNMFRRDLPAQKSFSKLRSAIGGLYAARAMFDQAERSFQEARMLYPVSPEANFRLIQEVLMRQGRYDEALDILDEYNLRDPNNSRGFDFANFIRRVRQLQARVGELTAQAQNSKMLKPDDAYELAMAYRELGQHDMAASYFNQLAEMPGLTLQRRLELATVLSSIGKNSDAVKVLDKLLEQAGNNIPAPQLLEAVRIFGNAQQFDKMYQPLSRYLQMQPNDWTAWLDMATVSVMRQQPQQFQAALQKAIELGRNEAVQQIQENPLLRQAAAASMQRMSRQPGAAALPGLGPRR